MSDQAGAVKQTADLALCASAMAGSAEVGIIGGSGFTRFLEPLEQVEISTPYGAPSGPLTVCDVSGRRVAFVPRHGEQHQLAPHRVNYRANIWALREIGVRSVLGPFAAGALDRTLAVGDLVLVDQLVDRTWGRADTYHDDFSTGVVHAPFADPYDESLRAAVLAAADTIGTDVRDSGIVVVIQGPRFGTRAESDWYRAPGLAPGEHDAVPRGGAEPRARHARTRASHWSPTPTPATRPAAVSPRRRSSPPSSATSTASVGCSWTP